MDRITWQEYYESFRTKGGRLFSQSLHPNMLTDIGYECLMKDGFIVVYDKSYIESYIKHHITDKLSLKNELSLELTDYNTLLLLISNQLSLLSENKQSFNDLNNSQLEITSKLTNLLDTFEQQSKVVKVKLPLQVKQLLNEIKTVIS